MVDIKNSALLHKLIIAVASIGIRHWNPSTKCWAMRYYAIYQLTALSSESVDWLFRRSLYSINYRLKKKKKKYRTAFSTTRACAVKTADCTAKNRLGTSILVVHRLARHAPFAMDYFRKFYESLISFWSSTLMVPDCFLSENTNRLLFCSSCTQKQVVF